MELLKKRSHSISPSPSSLGFKAQIEKTSRLSLSPPPLRKKRKQNQIDIIRVYQSVSLCGTFLYCYRSSFLKNEEAKVSREKAAKESKFLGLEKREQSQRSPCYATLPHRWAWWLQEVCCMHRKLFFFVVSWISLLSFSNSLWKYLLFLCFFNFVCFIFLYLFNETWNLFIVVVILELGIVLF